MDRRWWIGALSVVTACGGSGHENGSVAPTWPDARACSVLPDVNDPAMGGISGSDLSATICPNGAFAYIRSIDRPSAGTAPFYLTISGMSVAFQRPPGAFGGEVQGFIALSVPVAGTYTGPSGPDLEWVAFTYYLPPPASVHCEPVGPIECSPGCGRVCPVSGCGSYPCVPKTPSINYSASAWTLTLTSVANEGDSGLSTPHGSLTATMVEQDSDAGTADLSVTF
jgi:hypothetical protein